MPLTTPTKAIDTVSRDVSSDQAESQRSTETPRSDALETTRLEQGQERTPAYGDALALCRNLERELATARQALTHAASASNGSTLPAQPPVAASVVPVSPELIQAAKVALNTMDYMLENGEWYCAKERADALREQLEKVGPSALAHTSLAADDSAVLKRTATPLEALRAYEDAFDDLFCQCASNPITNAWGMQVNMSKLNHAHLLASTALQKNH